MNAKFLFSFTLSLALVAAVFAAEQGAASGTETGATAAVTAAAPAAQTSTNAEPTEKEMREAVQHSLDNLNSQMRPPATTGPSATSSAPRPYTYYSPYWRYYHAYWAGYKNSQESNYENWTDVAKRAHNTAKVEITSFKKIKCAPDEGGFVGEYVAELELRGAANPAAQEVMQTSGKRLKGFFFKGDKGWIFGEAPGETK